jgi:hypothetical protein
MRSVRPPEPFTGKGSAYEGEYIRRKVLMKVSIFVVKLEKLLSVFHKYQFLNHLIWQFLEDQMNKMLYGRSVLLRFDVLLCLLPLG